MPEAGAPKGQLNATDWKKIGRGAFYSVIGVLAAYVTEVLPGVELGAATPYVQAGWAILANVIAKLISDNTHKEKV